jgi:2-haloacid dehalogenase
MGLLAAVEGGAVPALVFDVFGTVVDWRSSVIREGEELGRRKGISVDWAKFADAWRAGYAPSMDRVRRGELPWTNLDALHRLVLDRLLAEFHVEGLTEAEKDRFNRVWHRLQPWPDAVAGLTRLKRRHVIATLSNGNVALLTNMAKHAGLPWDCILSSELARRYKPDPAVYQLAADLLGLRPAQVLMVAAHKGDLQAARKVGLKTAFVPRPREYGENRKPDAGAEPWIDVMATDFLELAQKLGA